MPEYYYHALRVVQQPGAKPFYLLSATAEELLQWADVPRKKANYMAGYQRDLAGRHTKIQEFFEQDVKNIIPGSVIVATRTGSVTSEVLQCGEVEQDVRGDACILKIVVDDIEFQERLRATYEAFLCRLSAEEREQCLSVEVDQNVIDGVVEEDEDDDSDSGAPQSYLSILTRELKDACEEYDSLPPERQDAVREYIDGNARPGRILDGQHRVYGAKEVQACSIYLPIVLLPDLPVAEQVFHFYVLNNKASPLRPTQLRSTISTSLTNKEIDELYDRLRASGIKAEEARWTHRVNNDSESPFVGLIDFGFGHAGAFVAENVMFQVVSKFMKPKRRIRKLLLDDVEQWHTDPEYRMHAFYAFWGAIRERYDKVWESSAMAGANGERSQLFMKASMVVLQSMLLEKMALEMPRRKQKGQASPFADYEDLSETIKTELYYLPPEFFMRVWQETGLDTAEGHEYLRGQMKAAIDRFGERIGHLPLFKAKPGKRN